MPRHYKKGVKPSPSGLPCRRCGAQESSGWRGINSLLFASKGCKDEAAAEAAHHCQPCEQQAAQVQQSANVSTKEVPMAHIFAAAAAVPLTAPIHGVPLAVPLPVAAVAFIANHTAVAHLPQAMAMPISTAAPPIPIAPTAPASGIKRAAPRVPLGTVGGNAPA